MSGQPKKPNAFELVDAFIKLNNTFPKDHEQLPAMVHSALMDFCEKNISDGDVTTAEAFLKTLHAVLDAEGKVLTNAKTAVEIQKLGEERAKIRLEILEKENLLQWRSYLAHIVTAGTAIIVAIIALCGVMVNKFAEK